MIKQGKEHVAPMGLWPFVSDYYRQVGPIGPGVVVIAAGFMGIIDRPVLSGLGRVSERCRM